METLVLEISVAWRTTIDLGDAQVVECPIYRAKKQYHYDDS